jgi:signal transduction histidine kinase
VRAAITLETTVIMKDERGMDRAQPDPDDGATLIEHRSTSEQGGYPAPSTIAALRHEIELRDAFIAAAAHELRNPLSPVYMQLEHLKAAIGSASSEISRPWLIAQLEAMTGRFDRFLDTLNRLLDASQLGEGRVALQLESCDLVEVVRTAVSYAHRELQAAGCAVDLAGPSDLVGWWDRVRLEQIVSNLVSNAARYGAGRPIRIRIHQRGELALVEVRDHGIGIAREDQHRIFQRFERARNVGRSSGFGVGLWVVAELCRVMGGTVEVASELGNGATFTVSLPLRR